MEDPEDSFSSARHLLLEVMAEQEGRSLLDAVRTYNRNAESSSVASTLRR